MNNLFVKEDVEGIYERMNELTVTSEHQWGIMSVDQMLAHCSAALEVANGRAFPPRRFIGYLLGGMFKHIFTNEKQLPKNASTDKSWKIVDHRDFVKEKEKLHGEIEEFYIGGEEHVTKHPHPFYGHLTPMEWSVGMWKHLDHHLRQFDV